MIQREWWQGEKYLISIYSFTLAEFEEAAVFLSQHFDKMTKGRSEAGNDKERDLLPLSRLC